MLQRIASGWRLALASLVEIKRDPILLFFPFVSGIALLLIGGLYISAIWGSDLKWWEFVPLYFGTTLVGVFSNATVMAAVSMRFDGEQPTIDAAVRLTLSKLPKLLVWTAVSTTVGLAIRVGEGRLPFFGQVMASLVGIAWSVITFLIVPVLLFEELGIKSGVRRSADLVRARWGEAAVGNISITALTMVMLFVATVMSFIFMSYSVHLGLIAWVASVVTIILTSQAMQSVFIAALYRYAVGDNATGSFSTHDLGMAFRPR